MALIRQHQPYYGALEWCESKSQIVKQEVTINAMLRYSWPASVPQQSYTLVTPQLLTCKN